MSGVATDGRVPSRLAEPGPPPDRGDGRTAVEREAADVRRAIAECTDWLASPASVLLTKRPAERPPVPGLDLGVGSARRSTAAAARRLRDEGLSPSLQIDEPLPWVSDGRGGASTPLTALALQLRYLRTSARLSYAAVRWLLSAVIGEDPIPWAGVVESRCGAEEDPLAAVAAVNATASLLRLSTRADTSRLLVPPRSPATARLSGRAHGHRVEEALRAAIATLAPEPFVDTIARRSPPTAFVRAAIVEQAWLVRHHDEALLPALTARLRPPIRRHLLACQADGARWRGQAEIAGAEVGVSPTELDGHLPLPWFQVLLDACLGIAQVDPGSLLAGLLITRGGPGDPFGMRRALLGPGGGPAHAGDEDAPVAYDERARALLDEVPSVTAFRHRSVVETVVLLAEMAERAWRLLLELHTDPAAGRWLPPAYHRGSWLPGGSGHR